MPDLRRRRRSTATRAGDTKNAIVEFRAAAARTANLRERHYLTTKVARLANERADH